MPTVASTSPAMASATPPDRSRSSTRSRVGIPGVVCAPHRSRALAPRTHDRPPFALAPRSLRHRHRSDRQPAPGRADHGRARSDVLRHVRPPRRRTRRPASRRARGFVSSSAAARLRWRGSRAGFHPSWSPTSPGTGSTASTTAFASAPWIIPLIQQAYTTAGAAWRLPIHGGFETFQHDRRRAVRRAARAAQPVRDARHPWLAGGSARRARLRSAATESQRWISKPGLSEPLGRRDNRGGIPFRHPDRDACARRRRDL